MIVTLVNPKLLKLLQNHHLSIYSENKALIRVQTIPQTFESTSGIAMNSTNIEAVFIKNISTKPPRRTGYRLDASVPWTGGANDQRLSAEGLGHGLECFFSVLPANAQM